MGNRLQSVDALRTLAIVAVIAIHTQPFTHHSAHAGSEFNFGILINQAARFAVPFFFVISGYFWALKVTDGKQVFEHTEKMVKRIAFLFIAWSIIYLLPLNIVDCFSYGYLGPLKIIYWHLLRVANSPLTTILKGTDTHLWFLMSLMCSLIISALFLRVNRRRSLIAVAVVLYAIGLAGKAYSATPIGFHVGFNFRDGPFFSLIFFVSGYFLQRIGPKENWLQIGASLTVLGVGMHFTELLVIHRIWGTNMMQDYFIGTYFLGVGVSMIALSNNKHLHFPVLASIGPLVLGIYLSHYAFVDILGSLYKVFPGIPLWDVSYVVAVFLLSYASSLMLSKHRLTRRLVV